jgi:(p)ppGpp synthase/HD superfamily hydrolase
MSTCVTLGKIHTHFGERVADLVFWLSNISKPKDGNRKARKAKDRDHLAMAPADAQTIKCADLIDNTQSIVQYDPDFAKVYIPEKLELLRVLTSADTGLWGRAMAMVLKKD